jgi:hypothetical protein
VISVGVAHSISTLFYAFEVVGTAGTTGFTPAMIFTEIDELLKPAKFLA